MDEWETNETGRNLTCQRNAIHNTEVYFEAIIRLPAATIEGAIGKLGATLVQFQPAPDTDEEPWPPLRAVRSDLRRLTPHIAAAI